MPVPVIGALASGSFAAILMAAFRKGLLWGAAVIIGWLGIGFITYTGVDAALTGLFNQFKVWIGPGIGQFALDSVLYARGDDAVALLFSFLTIKASFTFTSRLVVGRRR